MYLKKANIHNFLSIKATTVRFGLLNFILGLNGSGKSNIAQAIHITLNNGKSIPTPKTTPSKPVDVFPLIKLTTTTSQDETYRLGIGFRDKIPEQPQKSIHQLLEGQREHYRSTLLRPEITPLKEPRRPLFEDTLLGDASNLFDILHTMSTDPAHAESWALLTAHMRTIAPQIESMSIGTLGSFRLLQYKTRLGPDGELIELDSSGMSDGMLRALVLLTAVYQPEPPMTLIVEEPELHLHPRAVELLLLAMLSAPNRPQLIFTTHSPFILDLDFVKPEEIIVVDWQDGQTVAGSIGEDQMEELRERLLTRGELLTEGNFSITPMVWEDDEDEASPANDGEGDD